VSIRVLIVDDQALVRAGFRMILESETGIEIVGEAGDGAEAVTAVRELQPDVVLMDIRMPNLDGLEATRRILADGGDRPRVLMLTTFDLDEYVFEALRAGASGFLLKDSTPARLVTAIEAVAAGDSLFAPSVTRRLVEKYAQTPRLSQDVALGELTDREREVLALLAKGLSNAEISERLVVSLPTVKTHVGRVLSKLGLRDRVQAVVFAYEAGVVRVGEDP